MSTRNLSSWIRWAMKATRRRETSDWAQWSFMTLKLTATFYHKSKNSFGSLASSKERDIKLHSYSWITPPQTSLSSPSRRNLRWPVWPGTRTPSAGQSIEEYPRMALTRGRFSSWWIAIKSMWAQSTMRWERLKPMIRSLYSTRESLQKQISRTQKPKLLTF